MKLFVAETGTDATRELWLSAERRASSLLLYAEARAALARAVRAARIAASDRRATLEALDDLWARVTRLEVTESLVRRAGALAETYGLRGYDAVHLASCEEIADAATVFLTADGDLRAAARRLGIRTAALAA